MQKNKYIRIKKYRPYMRVYYVGTYSLSTVNVHSNMKPLYSI